MAFKNDPVRFSISVEGDTTMSLWNGDFAAKPFLTHRDRLKSDQYRRELIGVFSDNAGTGAVNRAFLLSQILVRLTKAPEWWTNSNNGLDLYDDNVILAIYEKCDKIEEEAIAAMKGESDLARKEIKEVLAEKKK